MRIASGLVLMYLYVFLIGAAVSLTLEDLNLDKCHLDNSTCMVKAFQNAIPTFSKGLLEWGVEVMDPLEISAKLDLAGLSLLFKEGQVKGMRNIIIKAVKWNENKKTVYVEYRGPTLTLSGKYLANGKILTLPITGNGDIKVKIKNLDVTITSFLDLKKKNGKTYASIKNDRYDFNVDGGARYNLTNLFNGNKELSETLLRYMNENWRDVTNELARPMMNAVAKKIYRNINKFLAHAPLEDISLSYQ